MLACTSALVCLVRNTDFGPVHRGVSMEVDIVWYGAHRCVAALLDVIDGHIFAGIDLREDATGDTIQGRATDL